MSLRAKILIVAVLAGALAAGLLWHRRQRGGKPSAASHRTPVALQRVGASRTMAPPGATMVAPDPAGDLLLEGQVIDASEQPVGGAIVWIDASPARQVTTGTDGSFAFDHLIGRDYQVEAVAANRHAGPVQVRLAGTTEPVILRLAEGGTVEVQVRDRDRGTPVAGAAVELRGVASWTATTGGDGTARLPGIGLGWPTLRVTADGYAPAARLIETSGVAGAVERQIVDLSRGAAASGRVLDPAGMPIAGARVIADAAAEPFPLFDPVRDAVTTDRDGRWTIPALAAGTYRFIADHASFAETASPPIALDGSHQRGGIDLRMDPGAVLSGVVRGGGGEAVAAARVRVVTSGGGITWRLTREAFSGSDGRFRIDGLPRRPADAVAVHDLGSSELVRVDLGARPEQEIELRLSVAGVLGGTVVSGTGEPVAEAQVAVEPEWTGALGERESWRIRDVGGLIADAGGRFRFTGLPAGHYRVRAAHPGAAVSELWLHPGTRAASGDEAVKVILNARGTVTGRVLYGDGSAPDAFTISIGGATPVPVASADGSFRVRGPGGKQNLTAEGPGFAPRVVGPVAIPEGGEVDAGTITVEKGRSVAGRVVDASGVPVAGATVAAGLLLTGGGAEVHMPSESIAAKDTTTDEQGNFLLTGFGDHPLVVVAEHPQKGRAPSLAIPRHVQNARVELVLQATGGLEGVVSRQGEPLPGTVVIANPRGAMRSNFFVVSGADGSYSYDRLGPGDYIVYAMIGSGGGKPKDMHVRSVAVTPGERAHADLEVPVGPGSLAVTVVSDEGAPVMAAQVAVSSMPIDAPTLAAARDTGPPAGASGAIYLRMAIGGQPAVAEQLPAGGYTACAVPIPADPNDPQQMQRLAQVMDELPMKCVPAKVGGDGASKVTVEVPAAWTRPPG